MNFSVFPGHLRLFIPVMIVIYMMLSGASPEVPPKDVAQAAYLKALPELEKMFDHCRGEGIFSTSRTSAGSSPSTVVKRANVEFAFAGDRGRLISTLLPTSSSDSALTSEPTKKNPNSSSDSANTIEPAKKESKPGTRVIFGYNPSYSFELSSEPSKSSYVVQGIEAGDKSGRSETTRRSGYAVHAASMAYRIPVNTFFGLKKFHLDRVTEIGTVTSSLLKFEFSIPLADNIPATASQIISGWLTVNPGKNWILNEYGIVRSNSRAKPSTTLGHILYKDASDGRPYPFKVDYQAYPGSYSSDPALSNPKIKSLYIEEFEMTKFQFDDLPARDFTLTAFGLPEFGQTVAQVAAARSFPWWILGVAVLLTGFAFGLRQLSRRHRSVATSQEGI